MSNPYTNRENHASKSGRTARLNQLEQRVIALEGGGGGVLSSASDYAGNFSGDGDIYIPAHVEMTLDTGSPTIGGGTLSYEKSTELDPEVFSATSLPVSLEANSWLRVSAVDVVSFLAFHLVRTS